MLQVKLYPKKEDSCRNLFKEELIAVTASNEEGKSSELAVKNQSAAAQISTKDVVSHLQNHFPQRR